MKNTDLETCWNYCLNGKITEEQKLVLLKAVLDDASFNEIKNKPNKVNDAFEVNLSNILLQARENY